MAQESGIVTSEKQVYEAEGLRADGSICAGEVLECDNDAAAIALAESSRQWASPIKLYRVPFVNMTGSASGKALPC